MLDGKGSVPNGKKHKATHAEMSTGATMLKAKGTRNTGDAGKPTAEATRTRSGRTAKLPTAVHRVAVPNPKLTQIVYEKLLRAIVQGSLDLGEPLSENDLARAMNLSKAPIRECLGELRLRGLVEVIPRSGSYVFSPTSEQIGELCDYRALLETNALRISMHRAAKPLLAELRAIVIRMRAAQGGEDMSTLNELDKAFHMAIVRHSENRYLTESYEHIGLTVEALRYRVMSTSQYRSRVQEEHERFVELLAKKQVSQAARVLESHILRVKRVQSTAEWGPGRLRRKDYRFRDYAKLLM